MKSLCVFEINSILLYIPELFLLEWKYHINKRRVRYSFLRLFNWILHMHAFPMIFRLNSSTSLQVCARDVISIQLQTAKLLPRLPLWKCNKFILRNWNWTKTYQLSMIWIHTETCIQKVDFVHLYQITPISNKMSTWIAHFQLNSSQVFKIDWKPLVVAKSSVFCCVIHGTECYVTDSQQVIFKLFCA